MGVQSTSRPPCAQPVQPKQLPRRDSKKRTRDLQEEMDQNKKAKVSGSPSTPSSRQGSSSQGGIQRAFARANTTSVQAAVAKFLYKEGIPFQKVESSSFKAMVAALQEAPGFVPPLCASAC